MLSSANTTSSGTYFPKGLLSRNCASNIRVATNPMKFSWAVSFCNSFPAAASVLEPPKEGYVEGGYLHNASLGWIQLPTSTGCLQTLLRGQVMRRESLWVDAFRCKIGWFWGRLGPSSLAQACYLTYRAYDSLMTAADLWPEVFCSGPFFDVHDRRIKSFLILGILNSKLPDNSVPTNKNRKGDIFFNKNSIACCVVHLFLWISKIPKIQWSPAVPRIPNQIILRGTTCGRLEKPWRYGAADNWVATISQVRRVLKLKSYTGGIVLNADKESDFLRNWHPMWFA